MIAALFVCRSSPYWSIPGVDCYDAIRDARTYAGPFPVVAHPPCRGWGNYRHKSKHTPEELDLGRWAVGAVRRFGGVLEHPAGSMLWRDQGLPRPGGSDGAGFCMGVQQFDFGHRALKPTWLYVCGASDLLSPLLVFGDAFRTVESMGRPERERTPLAFALWLVEQARLCRGSNR